MGGRAPSTPLLILDSSFAFLDFFGCLGTTKHKNPPRVNHGAGLFLCIGLFRRGPYASPANAAAFVQLLQPYRQQNTGF